MQSTPTTTKHTCGGPVFGRRTPGCPRCDELLAGAAPVDWRNAKADYERFVQDLKSHNCKAAGCSVVCTVGDW